MSDPSILLDFSSEFSAQKVVMLDLVVTAMYSGSAEERGQANGLLNQFKAYTDAWTYVDRIIENSQNPNSKFFALSILDEAVNTRWKILPENQKQGIRTYIITTVLKMSEDDSNSQHHLLTKLNATLVSIVKQEWQSGWQNFIPDICKSARDSQSKCENTLNILKLLSEEIFDFSKTNLLASEARKLKDTMTKEFGCIFELCTWVLQQAVENPSSVKPSLSRSCLKTLQSFITWIPIGYIYQTQLIEIIINHFVVPNQTRVEAIKCFTEIASLDIKELEEGTKRTIQERLSMYFCFFIQKVCEITKDRKFNDEFQAVQGSKQQNSFENLCRQVALSITAVMKGNLDFIEGATNTMEPNQNVQVLQQCVQKALEIVIQLSHIPEDELFKICLDFWHSLTYNILMKTKLNQFDNFQGINLGTLNASFMHCQVYPTILDHVREIMINQMAKPKEVLVVIDENGEAVEEHFDDTETISIYEQMREALIFLTNIDTAAMDKVIQSRLDRLTGDKQYFSFDRLNKLCWALGSISGCMTQDDENKFVVTVIKELLNLCEKTSGKSNKALVAADIMYVVGQFPRFLCSHWAFLKTVVKKLNEFMLEKHPGVQDMASETFLKISKLTKHMFVLTHDSELKPYVFELIRQIPENCRDLEQHQMLMVYEGIGHMVNVSS